MAEYIAVRCHAREAKLLSKEILLTLTEADDLSAIADILTLTDYSDKMKALKEVNIENLQYAINKHLLDRVSSIVQMAEENLRLFLNAYIKRYEVKALQKVLRAILAGRRPQKPIEAALTEVNIESICEAENLREAAKHLEDTIYRQPKEIIEYCIRHKTLLPMEVLMKKEYYDNLFQALELIPGEDRVYIEDIIRYEVDIQNTFTSIYPYKHNYNVALVKQLFIPYPKKLSQSIYNQVSESLDPRQIRSLLSFYQTLVDYILENEELLAHIESYRILLDKIESIKINTSINLTYVVIYFIKCEIERMNLINICAGKAYKMSPSEIRKYLIL